ncbi:hypothetical protein MNEG_5590 [Monoraphidium neglectum]|uniref:Uncharacterized protein n=1 Tax=Monoraphidium neglectum TaxID=145388 RepID=A0A0D2N9R0_9CHLO|nr:hypothetical protein MNEG_5590 [Monoraphidium neglectum]KIZ02371.1 hypothetical protein MNEG_5590 [Monoraphidium neglectum]|eukprot:XP_013901390.1 hypothetical protein MNEG_5590 [Monoraphidium neglectum]
MTRANSSLSRLLLHAAVAAALAAAALGDGIPVDGDPHQLRGADGDPLGLRHAGAGPCNVDGQLLDLVQVPDPQSCNQYFVCCQGQAVHYACRVPSSPMPYMAYSDATATNSYYSPITGGCTRVQGLLSTLSMSCPAAGATPVTTEWAEQVCAAVTKFNTPQAPAVPAATPGAVPAAISALANAVTNGQAPALPAAAAGVVPAISALANGQAPALPALANGQAPAIPGLTNGQAPAIPALANGQAPALPALIPNVSLANLTSAAAAVVPKTRGLVPLPTLGGRRGGPAASADAVVDTASEAADTFTEDAGADDMSGADMASAETRHDTPAAGNNGKPAAAANGTSVGNGTAPAAPAAAAAAQKPQEKPQEKPKEKPKPLPPRVSVTRPLNLLAGALAALQPLKGGPEVTGLWQLLTAPNGLSSTGVVAMHAALIPATDQVLLWSRRLPNGVAPQPGMSPNGRGEVSSIYDTVTGTYAAQFWTSNFEFSFDL